MNVSASISTAFEIYSGINSSYMLILFMGVSMRKEKTELFRHRNGCLIALKLSLERMNACNLVSGKTDRSCIYLSLNSYQNPI